MNRMRSEPRLKGEKITQVGALSLLLIMSGLAIAGPSGLLAWSENLGMLDQRNAELKQAMAERDALKNRVERLDPNGADPDLAGELVRRDLNVVHEDELVLIYK
ncbi:MAG: FtsB family cell division protein [Novosphingobium sp.]